jgi:SAM-dependent methyltransferase
VTAPALPVLPGDPTALKCACADLWAHPIAQLLAGPTLRPGGRELTRRIIDALGIPPGARALDVGSGTGATLAELRECGLHAFGLDYSRSLAVQAAEQSPVAVGDAESLPFPPGSFDVVLSECVLSALPDKPAALSEARRVLAPGGHIVMSDMTVSGTLPEPLRTVAAWAACVGGAHSVHDYERLLCSQGFTPRFVADASSALTSLVNQAERRLALLQGAMGVGLVEEAEALFGTELAQLRMPSGADGLSALAAALFSQVRRAIEHGELGYVAIAAVAA